MVTVSGQEGQKSSSVSQRTVHKEKLDWVKEVWKRGTKKNKNFLFQTGHFVFFHTEFMNKSSIQKKTLFLPLIYLSLFPSVVVICRCFFLKVTGGDV